ncbi:class I SAM-dependent methyltransferase [Rhodospirillaceae bacterium SYSU D60014]|uniref:class I SAM-dependent methyltransferase n=1 Tax=Virgifigura deserti TaxID=2268457 RepID=UPI000E673EBD
MVTALERTAYQLSQSVRLGWYSVQSALASRLSERVRAPAALRAAMPSVATLSEDRRRLMRRDLENIEAGYYRLPHDLVDNPAAVLRQTVLYFSDLRAVNQRIRRGVAAEVRAPDLEHYPDYYRRSFHHQTDGYLSRRSAELYDYQVEVLFGGAADAMRRQALVPLHHFLRGKRIADQHLADIGCGTGQFLTFVKDNYPRLPVTALDISPFYLDEARRRLRHWSRVTFVEAAAETMSLPEASVDIATCIYLFHELPTEMQDKVAARMARILKPGGMLIFIDSLQLGDRADYDALLEYFPMAFHEPYYADYLRRDLGRVFEGTGLMLEQINLAYLSRITVLRKPGTPADQRR